jgi:predicted GIY-YIG superfamily endonuclease
MQELQTSKNELDAETDGKIIDYIDLRPDPTFLYRYFDESETLLYVGMSKSYMTRFAQHKSDKKWIYDVKKITLEIFETRDYAHIKEIEAIEREKPLYNIAHQISFNNNAIDWQRALEKFDRDERDRIDLVIAKIPSYDLTELVKLCNGRIFTLEKIKMYSFKLPTQDNKPIDVFQYMLITDLFRLFNTAWKECLYYEENVYGVKFSLCEFSQYPNYVKLLLLTNDIIKNLELNNEVSMRYMGVVHSGKTWLGDFGAKMEDVPITREKLSYRLRQQCND